MTLTRWKNDKALDAEEVGQRCESEYESGFRCIGKHLSVALRLLPLIVCRFHAFQSDYKLNTSLAEKFKELISR